MTGRGIEWHTVAALGLLPLGHACCDHRLGHIFGRRQRRASGPLDGRGDVRNGLGRIQGEGGRCDGDRLRHMPR